MTKHRVIALLAGISLAVSLVAGVSSPAGAATSSTQATVTKLSLAKTQGLRFQATATAPTAITSLTTYWKYTGPSTAAVSPFYPLYPFDNPPHVYSWTQGLHNASEFNGLWVVDHLTINGTHGILRTMSRADLQRAGVQTAFFINQSIQTAFFINQNTFGVRGSTRNFAQAPTLSSVTADGIDPHRFRLAWIDRSTNETSWEFTDGTAIERHGVGPGKCPGCAYDPKPTGGTASQPTDNSYPAGTARCWKVRAVTPLGVTGWSNTRCARLP